MRKVIEAEAIVKLVREAAARITEHVNDHAAVPSLTKAETSALIREEGWSADDLGLEAEINWHDVDFEDAAYEVGSDTLIDAAMSNEGAGYVVKYALASMDDDDRAALLATLTPAAKPVHEDVYSAARAMLALHPPKAAARALLGMPEVTCEHIGEVVSEFKREMQLRVLDSLRTATEEKGLFPDDLATIKAELRAEVRAEVEREVREALIAKLFGAAKEGV